MFAEELDPIGDGQSLHIRAERIDLADKAAIHISGSYRAPLPLNPISGRTLSTDPVVHHIGESEGAFPALPRTGKRPRAGVDGRDNCATRTLCLDQLESFPAGFVQRVVRVDVGKHHQCEIRRPPAFAGADGEGFFETKQLGGHVRWPGGPRERSS